MEKIKHLVFDFDGTILDSRGEISDNLVNQLIDMQKRGYKVVLCSGRSLAGITWVANKIDLKKYNGYIVAYNGSQIYKYENQNIKQIHDVYFTKDQIKEMSSLVVDEVQCLATYCEDYMGVSNKLDLLERSCKSMGVDLSYDYIKQSPKMVLIDTAQVIAQKYDMLKDRLLEYDNTVNIFSSVPHLLEVTPKDSSKGYALKVLSQSENINKQEFICFGDAENDISMFEFCLHSVAMENAMDSVKALATHNTKTNNEDGVYHFLKTNF